MFREIVVIVEDMPFITSKVVEKLIHLSKDCYDACISTWSCGYIEPLCAVYRSRVIHVIEELIRRSSLSFHKLVDKIVMRNRVITREHNRFYN